MLQHLCYVFEPKFNNIKVFNLLKNTHLKNKLILDRVIFDMITQTWQCVVQMCYVFILFFLKRPNLDLLDGIKGWLLHVKAPKVVVKI